MERAVLGAMIDNVDALWRLKDRFRVDLFTKPLHRSICAAMHALADENRELSIPSVISKLASDSDNFSPEGYLATLMADDADPDELADNLSDLESMWSRREMSRLGQELIKQSTEDNGLDPEARLEAAKAAVQAIGDPLGSSVRSAAAIAQTVVARLNESMLQETVMGLEVGLKAVQDLTGPLMDGRMYVIAGPPGSGKSALAYQIGEFVSHKHPVLIEEIEMDGEELIQRDLASRTGISADRIERAAISEDEFETIANSAQKLNSLLLYIDGASNPTFAQIKAKAMRMKRIKGLRLLILDHLLYVAPMDKKANEFANIRLNLQALKKLARDLEIPVIVLSQLKKEYGEGTWQQIRRPNVNDLYGGSAIEQEADVVIFVHREEYLLHRKEPDKDAKDRADWEIRRDQKAGLAELVLVKRRGGKGYGVRTLTFNGPSVRFSD